MNRQAGKKRSVGKSNKPTDKKNTKAKSTSFSDKKTKSTSYADKKPKSASYSDKKPNSDSTPDNRSTSKKQSEGDRLNKYIAKAGICSRREADKYIESGLVSVNGKVVTEMGVKVFYGDKVQVNEATITPEKNTYILINKPKDYVTTLDDPHAKKKVTDLIESGCKERVFPVGVLDKTTTGLLLLTNDGDLADKIAHPSNNKKKIYQVTLNSEPTPEDLEQLVSGITLEDGLVKADEASYCNPEDKKEIGIEIHSAKNRVIRRMFESIGFNVKKLDRVYYAGLTKKNLPRGKWRFLSEKEIVMLKRGTFN